MNQANVFPIFYIKYFKDEELNSAINLLNSPLNAGTGNEGYSDKPVCGYGVQFSPEDKKYPYASDVDGFKQMVIECVYGLNEEQITKIVRDFVPFGQDMLYNKDLNCYVYFIGDSGVDITTSIVDTYRKKISATKRNFSSSPVQLKQIPQDMTQEVEEIINIIEIPKTGANNMFMQESKQTANIYVKVKIPVYTEDDIDGAKKKLKAKAFGVPLSDKDVEAYAAASSVGMNYYMIECAEPITEEQVMKILKQKVNNYGGKEMFIPEIPAYISFHDNAFDKNPKNVTSYLFNKYMNVNEDALMEGIIMVNKMWSDKTLN